jgi:N-acetylglutamate synthase-like GNAT family acetyltransferase
MAVHAVRVDWSTHQQQLRRIRERVFIEELGGAAAAQWDGLDDEAAQFIALNEAGIALGTARLSSTGTLGRVAVLAEYRHRGIGHQLLRAVVDHATELGLPRVSVLAPGSLRGFFHELGFRASTSGSGAHGATRVEMTLELPIPYEPTAAATEVLNPSSEPRMARASQLMAFDSEHACRQTIALMVADARRSVAVYSPSLEAELFASGPCLESFRQFARRRRTALQILVEDAKAIAAAGHPLLELARRLPSKIKLRRLPNDHAPARRDFMVVDEEAVWIRPDTGAFVGWANPHEPVEARRLLEEFNWLFERSTDDPELRLLSL